MAIGTRHDAIEDVPADVAGDPNPRTITLEPTVVDGEPCDLSVIVPLQNEEDNVEPLFTELAEVLAGTGLDYEMVFIDDGSKDQSLQRLRRVTEGHPRTTIISLRRNFGQTAAIAAGLAHSRGRIVVPMDADLQNDPHDIPALLAKLDEAPGYDVVSGWRKDRHDRWLTRRVPSWWANVLIRKITGVKLSDFGCSLKAYRREVLAGIGLYGELHRFLPALVSAQGARITELEVNHRPRVHGKTKYGLRRTAKVLLDLITVKFLGTYMTKPLYFFGKLSVLGVAASIIVLGMAIGQKYGLFWQPDGVNLNRNVLVPLSALLFFLGVQCILLGVVSELLVRIYHDCQDLPTYRIRRIYRGCSSDDDKA